MKEKIIQNKDGNIIYIDSNGYKCRNREKIHCKCGYSIDLYGAIKKGRVLLNHYLVICKKCGRGNSPLDSEIG